MNRIIKYIVLIAFCCMLCLSMGCHKNNTVEETNKIEAKKVYRFSETVGFQENWNPIWYEMIDAPMVIEQGEQTITIEQVAWMDRELKCFIMFDNVAIENIEENLREKEIVKLYSKEQEKWMEYSGCGTTYDREKDLLLGMVPTFDYENATDEVVLSIFGEEYTVQLAPIQTYNSLDEIGTVQTHNGRSVIINRTDSKIKAYTYSEDIWQIKWLGEWTDLKWKKEVSYENDVFTYIGKDDEAIEALDIMTSTLGAECKDVQVTIPVPEESAKVNIPFDVGEDSYRITEIHRVEDVIEDMGDSEAIDLYNQIGLFISVEPVQVEENTEVTNIQASLYTIEDVIGQSRNLQGEIETEVYGTDKVYLTSNHNLYYLDENYEITEPVLEFYVDKNSKLSEELILKIDYVSKRWTQPYHFELEP